MRHSFATAEHNKFSKVSTRSKLLCMHVSLHDMYKDGQLINAGQHLLYTAHECHA